MHIENHKDGESIYILYKIDPTNKIMQFVLVIPTNNSSSLPTQEASYEKYKKKSTHSRRSFQNISQLVLHRRSVVCLRSNTRMVHRARCGGRDGTTCSCSW